jgi:Holliday junction resolvasome RuvABC DNA-binding subunit
VAQLLEAQAAISIAQAYRRAAKLCGACRARREIVRREGEPGLRRLPGIGESLARSIATLVLTGKLPMLHRLRGESDAGLLLASVPGIGKALASRLHHDLGIETLEELQAAADDGRLRKIAGIGYKRLAAITDSLSARLGRVRPLRAIRKTAEPAVAEILDVDREYREKSTSGALRMIAPRRFNPNHEAWLPILHAVRGERHYMALFQHRPCAPDGKTRDWVVLYYDGREGERQCTVITSQRGRSLAERIVRGREVECLDYYRDTESASTPATGDREGEPSLGRAASR